MKLSELSQEELVKMHSSCIKKENGAFYRGFACALAEVSRTWHHDSIVKYIMNQNGITLEDLKKAEVEKFDLDIIRKCL
ncbi:hypothetical protein LPTSP1_36810 [Leptospira johnsonii]|uniref:Uncharacterized protein n=1 Tax=Leptospira johnsonii TaxID=1917820 RepID=A0A2P2D7R0_9LEPT|nr:hypothetical protein LPTSP1_36810 [Leptospira johnsonii]